MRHGLIIYFLRIQRDVRIIRRDISLKSVDLLKWLDKTIQAAFLRTHFCVLARAQGEAVNLVE